MEAAVERTVVGPPRGGCCVGVARPATDPRILFRAETVPIFSFFFFRHKGINQSTFDGRHARRDRPVKLGF